MRTSFEDEELGINSFVAETVYKSDIPSFCCFLFSLVVETIQLFLSNLIYYPQTRNSLNFFEGSYWCTSNTKQMPRFVNAEMLHG